MYGIKEQPKSGLYSFEDDQCQVCENSTELKECCEGCGEFWGCNEAPDSIKM